MHSGGDPIHRASPSHPQAGVFKRQRCCLNISHEAEGRVRGETDSVTADVVGPSVSTDESTEQAGRGGDVGGGGLPGREGDRGRAEGGGHRQAGEGGNVDCQGLSLILTQSISLGNLIQVIHS